MLNLIYTISLCVLLSLVSCAKQEEAVPISIQSGGELGDGPDLSTLSRFGRYAKGFMDDLDFDAAGANGQLTTMCTGGYTPPHGCSISCNFGGGFYTDATLVCNGDSSTPTTFATVGCASDSFTQGFQGGIRIEITRLNALNITLRIIIGGDLYLLKLNQDYSAEGIYTKWIDAIMYFNRTTAGVYTYNCMGDSAISVEGTALGCAAASIADFSCI